MPTYQYACTACEHQLEAVQSFSDPSLTECPECHGKLRKLYSGVGIVFKGSGFYRTDSRDTGSAKINGSADKSDKSSTDSGASKSADKPAASSTDKSSADKGSASTSSAPKSSTPAAATAS